MQETAKQEAYLHYNMAFIGGFLGLYTIITRCELLGAAQTSNLLCLVQSLVGGDIYGILSRLGGLILYSLGILLTVWLPKQCAVNLKALSILIDMAAILILGFLPADMDPVVAIYPVFFSMSFQWCSFRGIDGCVSATTFSTNNLRQFLTALYEYLTTRKAEKQLRMRFYGCTLAAFHIGAAVSCTLYFLCHLHSVWFGLIPAVFALRQVWLEARRSHSAEPSLTI